MHYNDHDEQFDPKIADVSGVRPDADISAYTSPDSEDKLSMSPHKPWRIYPKPPLPHWHWTANTESESAHGGDEAEVGQEEFVFKKCEIPSGHDRWSFSLDEAGVYQVQYRWFVESSPLLPVTKIAYAFRRRQEAGL